MTITWLSFAEKRGNASLYDNNITLSTVASSYLEVAFRVQVGLDENKNIVLCPITKDRYEIGDLDESLLLPIQFKRTYSRINSVNLMKKLASCLNLELSKTPIKFETRWDNDSNCLIIITSKE